MRTICNKSLLARKKIFGSIKAYAEFCIQIIIDVKIFYSRQIRAKLARMPTLKMKPKP